MPKMPIGEVQIVEDPFKPIDKVNNIQTCSGMVCHMSLDHARGHKVIFVDDIEEISDLETEEEVEVDSGSSSDTDANWETNHLAQGILTYRLHEKLIKVPNVRPLPPPPPKVLSNAYTLFFDGTFRRATGKAGGGLVLVNPEGEVVMKEQVTLDGSTSNNETEYDILISGLKICLAQKIRRLMVKGDALLIVKQILGIWACKNERLRTKVTSIRKLFSQFEEVQLYHIPRKENEDADLLAQQAVSNQDKAHVVIATIALKDPQYAGMESLTPVVNYILEGEFPKEFTTGQRRKLIKQASTFLWLEGSLYQKGKDLVCRRVPSTNEIPKILKGLHEEACGGHFSHELTLKKVLLAGYVWPSMHADVQHWCRTCHNCQVNGNKRLLYGPRQAVIVNGPFEKWEIDAMGPLPRTANGKLYILVAIDYMTRWVETQRVAKVNEKTVSKFVYTHICCRFGTPLEIVSDNGPGFRRGLLTEVCEELKISHRHSTPYYPQSNGLVEKANGIIAGIIRKMVESKPKRWDNFLDGAIWAYKTTYRDATQFTPFHLVYGQEALQPIELNIPTIKLTGRQEQNNDEAWIDRLLNLVELEWKREAAYHCYEKKALQLKDKVNEGIKDKEIKEKSLVLRYNNALDNRFDAKFERRWEGPFIVKKAFTGGYYQLMDLNGKEHPRKVNGYRLKPYLSRILPAVFETKQVSKKTKKDFWLETAKLVSSSGSGYWLVSGSGFVQVQDFWLLVSFRTRNWTGYWLDCYNWSLIVVIGSRPLAGTQGSGTQDPHIAASDSSSDFDVMEGYPMQRHAESSSQDMHALGQQPGVSMFSRLKETLSRATRSEHATNEINEGGGEVDSPFTSQIDPLLFESVHVSTPATTPIGLSKLTPSETLLPDGRSLAEVQEVERYILAAREKEIKSLRKAKQRRATLAKAPMTSTNPL
ncbi:hypothetical protein L7F22_015164 [Adiantum nelumboides]|nr:hypothetical protein [Adiantum nelumboides]